MAVRPLDLNGTLARASAAIFAVDGHGRITLWNRAIEKLLGHSAGEAIGRPSCTIVGAGGQAAPALCYRGCHSRWMASDGPMTTLDLRTRTRAGRLIHVNVTALVIAGPKDRGLTVMHLLREVTPPPHAAGVNGHGPVAAERRDAAALTRREIDVLRLMGAGLNTRAIADHLSLSAATVRNHVQSILGKLGVHSRLAAVAVAHGRALI